MKPDKIWNFTSRVFDQAQIAAWALALSAMFCLFVFGVPILPKYWVRAEAARIMEVAAENASFCEKLGIIRGANDYERCLLILDEFRLKVEKRITNEQDI